MTTATSFSVKDDEDGEDINQAASDKADKSSGSKKGALSEKFATPSFTGMLALQRSRDRERNDALSCVRYKQHKAVRRRLREEHKEAVVVTLGSALVR